MDRVSAGRALGQPYLAAFIQVLSSVGQLRPDIFAPHAAEYVDFVLRTLLPCGAPFCLPACEPRNVCMHTPPVDLVNASPASTSALAYWPDLYLQEAAHAGFGRQQHKSVGGLSDSQALEGTAGEACSY